MLIINSKPVSCPAGTYKGSGMAQCVACQANTISSYSGASSCTLCSPGSVSNGDRTVCGKKLRVKNFFVKTCNYNFNRARASIFNENSRSLN